MESEGMMIGPCPCFPPHPSARPLHLTNSNHTLSAGGIESPGLIPSPIRVYVLCSFCGGHSLPQRGTAVVASILSSQDVTPVNRPSQTYVLYYPLFNLSHSFPLILLIFLCWFIPVGSGLSEGRLSILRVLAPVLRRHLVHVCRWDWVAFLRKLQGLGFSRIVW